MKPSAAQLRELKRNNLRYPAHLVAVPRDQWPDMSRSPYHTGSIVLACFRSRSFLLCVWLEPNGFERLSINRAEWDERQRRFRDDISWDDIQRLKAQAGYADRWAVEIFPSDDQVVNVANMRHVWLLDEAPRYAWLHRTQELPA